MGVSVCGRVAAAAEVKGKASLASLHYLEITIRVLNLEIILFSNFLTFRLKSSSLHHLEITLFLCKDVKAYKLSEWQCWQYLCERTFCNLNIFFIYWQRHFIGNCIDKRCYCAHFRFKKRKKKIWPRPLDCQCQENNKLMSNLDSPAACRKGILFSPTVCLLQKPANICFVQAFRYILRQN